MTSIKGETVVRSQGGPSVLRNYEGEDSEGGRSEFDSRPGMDPEGSLDGFLDAFVQRNGFNDPTPLNVHNYDNAVHASWAEKGGNAHVLIRSYVEDVPTQNFPMGEQQYSIDSTSRHVRFSLEGTLPDGNYVNLSAEVAHLDHSDNTPCIFSVVSGHGQGIQRIITSRTDSEKYWFVVDGNKEESD